MWQGDPTDVTDNDLLRLLSELLQQSFLQIALVLVSRFDMYPKGEAAVFTAFIDTLLTNADRDGLEGFLKTVRHNFN